MRDSIFFHEDFYKQIELIPSENYFAATRVIDEYPDPNGDEAGFHNCYVREENKVKTESKKILFNDVKELLDPISLSFDTKVTSGYSTTTYKMKNTVVWGFEDYGIFIDFKNDFVEHIWICDVYNFESNEPGYNFFNALLVLSKRFNLILVDWNIKIIVNTANKNQLQKYMNQELAFEIIDEEP